MRFLIDAQLPPALARLLSANGHLAEHVNDIGMGDAADETLWAYALDHGAVLVTKDEDFANMVITSIESPCVLWIRTGNTRRLALLAMVEPLIDQIVATFGSGETFIELR